MDLPNTVVSGVRHCLRNRCLIDPCFQLLHQNKGKIVEALAFEKQPTSSIFLPLALARCKDTHKDHSIKV